MNTPLSSDADLAWSLTCADGQVYTNTTSSWSEITEPITRDDIQVYETMQPITAFSLTDPYRQIHQLLPPTDRAIYLFAFKRMAASVTTPGRTQWLYTCFGYLLPTYRILLCATPTGTMTIVQPRIHPFLL